MATEEKIVLMEAIKKERKVLRSMFTKNANVLETQINACTEIELPLSITIQYLKVQDIQRQLMEADNKIRLLIQESYGETEIEDEIEGAMEYQSRGTLINLKYTNLSTKKPSKELREKRNFKLPTLQFITFDGDLKSWLPFWGQFQKINDDDLIDPYDKYQYLLQAMKDGSEPKALVEGFTPAAYRECVDQLKARYAREELLIQVYVREMLGMINKFENTSITVLFDKLSAHLRALETLGVTKDKFAAFLLPMVESALPQDLLKIWERNKEAGNITNELSDLLTFLQREVESEQRISLAKKSFEKLDLSETQEMKEPTAGCLLTMNKQKQLCIWCDKDSHSSLECFKLQKMTVEERRAFLKKIKACAICLKKGHHPKYCKAHIKCVICGQRHSVVLCTGKKQEEENSPPPPRNQSSANLSSSRNETLKKSVKDSRTKTDNSAGMKTETTLLQTVSVIIGNRRGKQVKVRAMFDSGAQRSYVKEDVARLLDLTPVGNETLTHTLFGGVESTSKKYNLYDLNVTSLDKKFSFKLTVLGQTCICRNIPVYTDADITQILTKHKITLSDNSQHSDDIGLLIGADFSGLVFTGDIVRLHDSLIAINTKLGWTLQGKVTSTPSMHTLAAHVALHCSVDVSNFWSLETLGIRDPIEMKTKQQNEEEVLANFEESVTINQEGRYEVVLPWKVGHDEIFDNFDLSSRRLLSVTKRLKSNNLYEDYNNVINDWRDQGIVEMVPDPTKDLKLSHYLPHRPVIKERSLTTRIRPVFDASAKDRQGKSLNLCLDKGVNMLDKIPKLLNGFRKGAIGITADISKAFLQVSVSPKDRDMLRFLWWDDEGEILTYRHCRVVFGLTSSPFLLSATIQHHLNQVTGDLKNSAEILRDSFYVDNCLTSSDSEEHIKRFKTEAKQIMSQAKFNLTQWAVAPTADRKDNEVVSVLGLEWHMKEDELGCNMGDLPPPCELGKITKRNLLSLTQRIYDPIGFTTAVTLVPRMILQETWRRKIDWDEELPGDLKKKFTTWYQSLNNLENCRIPRRLTSTPFDDNSLQLHMFCDASQDGYAACVYLRAENRGKISVRLISAKSRVSPPEKPSIPRLELLAALIGSRLLVEARKDLKINCVERCWTDSGVALCWIKKELPWNTYVGNRVKEIRINTNTGNWFHIPGKENMADILSRGCNADELLSSRWLEGPVWLYLKPEQWPRSTFMVDEAQASHELKKSAVCNTNICRDEGMISQLTYFSKYTMIVRTVAWMLRFSHNALKNKIKIKGELSYEEYEEAEKRIIRLIQTANKDYIEKKIQGLTHFYDDKDGLIKIKTKLLLTDVPESTKFPVVLPAKSTITRRLVEQSHAQLQHAGLGTVMADMRSRYWVIGARQLVKSVIAACNVCKRHRARATRAPTAPLPRDRTQCSAVFEITGVDLAGPLYLRGGNKCWVVLYTCAVYRAVHLELTESLSTEAFIMTLRRFIARRGRVRLILSDNGTNFVGTKNLLSDLDWNEIQQQSTVHRIKWKLNAPTAAWWGGFWERLVKILKDMLKRVLGQSTVTYVELETILCDCEATMNGRPLTYIEDEKTLSLEPLTPSCFLQPISQNDVPDLDDIDARSLNKRLRYIQKLREDFRQRFRTEYLTTLVQKGKEKKDSLKIGDVVLIETEQKRIKSPLGIIEEIFVGRDKVDRTAKVRTSTGYKVRPFQRLFKLEIADPATSFKRQEVECEDGEIPTAHTDIPHASDGQPDAPAESALQVPTHQNKVKENNTTRSGRVIRLPSRYWI